MKERNQLRVCIFLADARQRTGSGSAYSAVAVAGVAGIRLEDGEPLQDPWVGSNQRSRCTSRRGLRDKWFLHKVLRILILLPHLCRYSRIAVVIPITGYTERRVGNQEEQECAYHDWPSPWPAFEPSIQKRYGGKDQRKDSGQDDAANQRPAATQIFEPLKRRSVIPFGPWQKRGIRGVCPWP